MDSVRQEQVGGPPEASERAETEEHIDGDVAEKPSQSASSGAHSACAGRGLQPEHWEADEDGDGLAARGVVESEQRGDAVEEAVLGAPRQATSALAIDRAIVSGAVDDLGERLVRPQLFPRRG